MSKVIDSFSEDYAFLSNFYVAEVILDGVSYPTVEHAYQAAKTLDKDVRSEIRRASYPGQAKKLGKKLKLRRGWDALRLSIMENLLRQKFSNERLCTLLLETGTSKLVEGNWWNDTFWGVCRGAGKNHLGRLLMKIRDEL